MIDRGISENYVILWIDLAADRDPLYLDRIERALKISRNVTRRGSRERSLVDLYDQALNTFNGNRTLAAEFLRRALAELASPTPVDDGLPPPDSWVWEHLRTEAWFYALPRYEPSKPPHPQSCHPGSTR